MNLKTQLHTKSNQNANPQTEKKNYCFSSVTQTGISQNTSNRHIPPLKYLPMSSIIGNRTELYCFLRLLCCMFSIFWQNVWGFFLCNTHLSLI